MRSAIIIGGSSGIGRALAVTLSLEGYRVGVIARRTDLLVRLRTELTGPCVIKTVDVSQPESAMPLLRELIDELGDVELFIVSAGTGFENAALAWEPEKETIALNVLGFAGMVNVAVAHLETRGSGQLVGISSVAALRGNGVAPAYAASKAFVSNYLQGGEISLQQVEAANRRHRRATRLRRHTHGEGGPPVLGCLFSNGRAADRGGDPRAEAARVHHQPLATHRMAAARPARCGLRPTLNSPRGLDRATLDCGGRERCALHRGGRRNGSQEIRQEIAPRQATPDVHGGVTSGDSV